MAKRLMMVLNDGETYTDLAGCTIVEINESLSGTYETDELVRYAAAGLGGRIITVFTDPND